MHKKVVFIFILFFSLLLLITPIFSFLSIGAKQIAEEKDDYLVKRSMFPHDFLFGVSTSAYQIEGGYNEDGKGVNNWDYFFHLTGNTASSDNGDVADDHYHRYLGDIDRLEFMGVNAYRFSISWTRILPRGRFGPINPNGVMFYNKIIDNLLLKGIEPLVTIHHNDIPQELEDRYGSWLSPQMQDDLVFLAKTCFENFGDRVKKWVTINEPNIHSEYTYMNGVFPPQRCSPPFGNCTAGNSDVEPLISAHNMLIAHAKAVKLYREHFQSKQGGSIGLVLHAFHFEPYTDNEYGYQAVQRAYAFYVGWILSPLIYGDYPSLMHKYLGDTLPKFSKDEVELVKGSLDFLGLNHYTSFYAIDCFHSTDCTPTDSRPIRGFAGRTINNPEGVPIGEEMGVYGFHVVPSGMEKVLNYVNTNYPNLSIYITENGYCPPNYQGFPTLDDFKRIKFHETYLASLLKAMRNGTKVKGYFAWSFLDNYEWGQGYNISFGFYYVNRKTLERTPRLSAKWYASFLANGGSANISSF